MSTGKPVFAFTPHEAALLIADIGRTDVASVAFLADVEACLQAFEFAVRGGLSRGLPAEVAEHLDTITRAGSQLRIAMYRLPDDVAMLLDLHLLSEGARRRIAADFSQLVEPLEDVTGAIAEIRRSAATDPARRSLRLEEQLVRAIAAAYRNRLNRKPGVGDDSGFPKTVHDILEFAGHRLPGVAAAAAAITPARLRQMFGDASRGERSAVA